MRSERSTALQRQQAASAWHLIDALPLGSTLKKVTEARSLGLSVEAIAAKTGLSVEDVADIHAIGLALIAAAEAAG